MPRTTQRPDLVRVPPSGRHRVGRAHLRALRRSRHPRTKTLVGCNACGMIYDDTPLKEPQVQDDYRKNDHYAYSGVGEGAFHRTTTPATTGSSTPWTPGPMDSFWITGAGKGVCRTLSAARHIRCRHRAVDPTEPRPSVGSSGVCDLGRLHCASSARSNSCPRFSHALEHCWNPATRFGRWPPMRGMRGSTPRFPTPVPISGGNRALAGSLFRAPLSLPQGESRGIRRTVRH